MFTVELLLFVLLTGSQISALSFYILSCGWCIHTGLKKALKLPTWCFWCWFCFVNLKICWIFSTHTPKASCKQNRATLNNTGSIFALFLYCSPSMTRKKNKKLGLFGYWSLNCYFKRLLMVYCGIENKWQVKAASCVNVSLVLVCVNLALEDSRQCHSHFPLKSWGGRYKAKQYMIVFGKKSDTKEPK